MAVGKRDRHTGQMTTGHEWNGIEELNTPVPPVIYIFLGLAFAFSVIYWLLMPAWPLGLTYTKGVLGITQHSLIDTDLKNAAAENASWANKIAQMKIEDIQADPALMHIVRETARPIFDDNCAACHGINAQGGNGYPNLTDEAWLWGGSSGAIMKTLRVGVNASHEDTRISQMMAFGRDGILGRDTILNITAYVQSLSTSSPAIGPATKSITTGREEFEKNCAACHGKTGAGNTELGAPNLTDNVWLYGGDRQSIYTTINSGRQGHMPSWENRLSNINRKILTLYILDLSSKKP